MPTTTAPQRSAGARTRALRSGGAGINAGIAASEPRQAARIKIRHETRIAAGKGTLFRLRRHLIPHGIAAGMLTIAFVIWMVDRLNPGSGGLMWLEQGRWTGPITTAAAVTAFGLVAAVWAAAGSRLRRTRRWRRVLLAALAGSAWLTAACWYGPSWEAVAALILGELALGLGYWRDIRIPAPSGPPAPEAETGPKADEPSPTFVNWAKNIACEGGPVPGSYLTAGDSDDTRERWTVQVVPGKQSIDTLTQNLKKIASGLRIAIEDLIIEPHEGRDSSQVRLTIVHNSPIREDVLWTGPKYFRDGYDSWIEPGWYADGEGRVKVPVYAHNSMRNLEIIGGQGSGKTEMLDQMALSVQDSGHTVVWYLDGGDGESSPVLLEHADWAPTGPDREERMLTALERAFAYRSKLMKRLKVPGLNPSPELPGLLVIVDEHHEFWHKDNPNLGRWLKLLSRSRKRCVGFWAATQHPEIQSFGSSDKLRSLLMQFTCLVLRTAGQVAGNILRIKVDLSELPTLPGYGYVIGGHQSNVRTAPFRGDHLDEVQADAEFRDRPGCELDKGTAHSVGRQYVRRHQIAEDARRQLEEHLDALERGEVDPDTGNDQNENAAAERPNGRVPAPAGGFETELGYVPAWPQPPAGLKLPERIGDPDPDTGDAIAAVEHAVLGGAESFGAIQDAAGYGKSQTRRALEQLIQAGRITKAGHGRYTIAGVDDLDATDDETDIFAGS